MEEQEQGVQEEEVWKESEQVLLLLIQHHTYQTMMIQMAVQNWLRKELVKTKRVTRTQVLTFFNIPVRYYLAYRHLRHLRPFPSMMALEVSSMD